ncbi:MAG: membrane protein insertion efficiency factor YidD [Chloroflexia bacterium]|nr:membrane protein insertion efficiency factor YidD [Chloroflexia bacterium]
MSIVEQGSDQQEASARRGTTSTRRHGPITWLALGMIRLYRRFVSPLMPPACRFVPSCTEFGYEAIAKYGIIRGGRLAAWRILRCNPFTRGGYDPVP